jgi:hypothetical protein
MLIEGLYELLQPVNANTYPGVAEQEVEAPFIVHAQAKTIPYPSKDGKSTLDQVIIKVASYAKLQTEAQLQAEQIRLVLDEFTGSGTLTADNTTITVDSTLYTADMTGTVPIRIRFVDEESGYDPEQDLHFTLQTYRFWINFNTL